MINLKKKVLHFIIRDSSNNFNKNDRYISSIKQKQFLINYDKALNEVMKSKID